MQNLIKQENFGEYRLSQLIASGEAAEVWLASSKSDVPLVIKRILPPWSNDRVLRRIFFEIIKDFALLRHTHLVAMLDFGQLDEYLYVVYERVDGIFLRQLLRAEQQFDDKQALILIAGLLSGLSYLHQTLNPFTGARVNHSDVSPANLLVDTDGRPRIVDMGFSRIVFEAGLPGKPSVPDPRYIAPEVLTTKVCTASSDVYGAGRIIEDLLPFTKLSGNPILELVVKNATASSAKRYPDATAMLRDLTPLLEDYAISSTDAVLDNYSGWSAALDSALNTPAKENSELAVLSERYEIIAELGRGAMGVVLHARDKTLDEVVAIKLLNASRKGKTSSTDETTRNFDLSRFHQELKLARKVNHPNVARVYHLEELRGVTFYSMEYVDGTALHQLLLDGPLSIDQAMQIFLQLTDGLEAIHRCGVIHRDIKPANILLQKSGRAVITDFGVAKREDDELGITQDGIMVGTPIYMAPEQMTGKAVDQRSDLYSLGILMYEVLTGLRPHKGKTSVNIYAEKRKEQHTPARSVNPKISRRLDSLITSLLHASADKRPSSAAAVRELLSRC